MLCLDQCVAMSGLGREEVDLIAEHEGVPTIVAAEMGNQLLTSDAGILRLQHILRHRLNEARARGDCAQAQYVFRTYARFCERYPARFAA